MKAILEQNFDELYAQAKERIEACVVPVEQMTTFTFFVMWNTINQILFDVFHETRFMWNITGAETNSELRIRFLDQFKTVSTNEIVVTIRNEFKLISHNEFIRMSHSEKREYVNMGKKHGYSGADLSRHFGKCGTYVCNTCWKKHESFVVRYGEESIIARETLKRMNKEDIPLIIPVWRMIFQKFSHKAVLLTMLQIQNGERSTNAFVDSTIEKAANDKFINYLESLMPVVDEMIRCDSSDRTYGHNFAVSLGRNLKLRSTRVRHTSDNQTICGYRGESLEKLKKLQQKLEKIITANKGGKNGSVQ